jgi:hypothetical protein
MPLPRPDGEQQQGRFDDTSMDPRRSVGPAVFAMMKESRAREKALGLGSEIEGVHRGNQEADRVYIVGDDDHSFEDHDSVFVSPDGEGRHWYDTPHQAFDQHGVLPVTYVNHVSDIHEEHDDWYDRDENGDHLYD